jgi:hypothetical protein
MFMGEGGLEPRYTLLVRNGSWQLDLPRRGFEDGEVCLCGAKFGLLLCRSRLGRTLCFKSGTSLRLCCTCAAMRCTC